MTTIRRTFIVILLLAAAFFIYRTISPSGADELIGRIKEVPVRLGLTTGDVVSFTTGDVFVSSAFASGMPSLEAFRGSAVEDDEISNDLMEVEDIVLVPDEEEEVFMEEIEPVIAQASTTQSSSSTTTQSSTSQPSYASDIEFLNALFK